MAAERQAAVAAAVAAAATAAAAAAAAAARGADDDHPKPRKHATERSSAVRAAAGSGAGAAGAAAAADGSEPGSVAQAAAAPAEWHRSSDAAQRRKSNALQEPTSPPLPKPVLQRPSAEELTPPPKRPVPPKPTPPLPPPPPPAPRAHIPTSSRASPPESSDTEPSGVHSSPLADASTAGRRTLRAGLTSAGQERKERPERSGAPRRAAMPLTVFSFAASQAASAVPGSILGAGDLLMRANAGGFAERPASRGDFDGPPPLPPHLLRLAAGLAARTSLELRSSLPAAFDAQRHRFPSSGSVVPGFVYGTVSPLQQAAAQSSPSGRLLKATVH